MTFVMSAGLAQVENSLGQALIRSGDQFVIVQECFRHFDLDEVGNDGVHLSLFEMPGAFIFGTDVKKRAIYRMWELATQEMGIDADRIWISYFGGGELAGLRLSEDELTHQTWLEIGVPEARLVGLDVEHNYWMQGGGIKRNGEYLRKCGANTELFYDRGVEWACGPACRPSCKCGRFIEFSNSLFISHEFDHQAYLLKPIEFPLVETVIGTERVAMILQNLYSIFDIPNLFPIIKAIQPFITRTDLPSTLIIQSQRVIADYLRALHVLIADGAPPPGKNGRERIIKLLIRGAITRQILLGIMAKEFLPTIIEVIAGTLDPNFRAIHAIEKLKAYFKAESQRFRKTIERGWRRAEALVAKKTRQTLSGQEIVFLEKKMGIPHLLTAAYLLEKGVPFPEAEYKTALKAWRPS
jgi:alanyl-tRNA synthetase